MSAATPGDSPDVVVARVIGAAVPWASPSPEQLGLAALDALHEAGWVLVRADDVLTSLTSDDRDEGGRATEDAQERLLAALDGAS